METEFYKESVEGMSDQIKGKTVESIYVDEEGPDNSLNISFTDGTRLCIRYDYIYAWEII